MTTPEATLIAVPLSLGAGLPEAWLSPAEAERAAAYDDGASRARFLAGRLGVRFALAAHLGAAAVADPGRIELAGRCPRCGPSAHGQPLVRWDSETLPLSLSYSRVDVPVASGAGGPTRVASGLTQGWLLVGVAPGDRVLGVDVCAPIDEWQGIFDDRQVALLRLLPDALRAREAARRWALIEARGKAVGHGMVPAPHHREVPPAAAEREDPVDWGPGRDGAGERFREWAGSLGALGTRIAAVGTEAEAHALPSLRAGVVLSPN
ncbi:4'-phosphopantetheinyl transferase family protein [Zhihengliuella flava]|uniref:Phosphopantetheinyl transferase n=1 Tax=Zhihengliuella flava TaxID=1285193 RepID=A0A931D838_9MICC|nr:hypothetical protein [Zhihengliuella flava]MBG6083743.1 phosphopantetheinyl transferase [Zhihengliuella flava]